MKNIILIFLGVISLFMAVYCIMKRFGLWLVEKSEDPLFVIGIIFFALLGLLFFLYVEKRENTS